MNTEEVSIRRVSEYTPELAAGIGRLMPYLSDRFDGSPVDEQSLKRIIASPDREKLIAEASGRIVGAATPNLIMSDIRGQDRVYLDNFVTDLSVRGLGAGYKLWQAFIEWGREYETHCMDFTSNDKRDEAQTFYFRQRAYIKDTTPFRIDF